MEGQKKPNWADESDEESSGHEDHPVHESKSSNQVPDQRKEQLLSKIKNSNFPLTLELSNLSYKVKESVLAKYLGIPENSITFVIEEEKFAGNASVKLENVEEALMVAEKAYTEVFGRIFFVNFPRNRGYQGREFRGERRGDRRGGRRGGRQGHYEEKAHFERKFEPRSKDPEGKTGKIVIAREKKDPATMEEQRSKPKVNPFGDAKPIDTLNRDLEFEKTLHEAKKNLPEDQPESKEVETTENAEVVDDQSHEKRGRGRGRARGNFRKNFNEERGPREDYERPKKNYVKSEWTHNDSNEHKRQEYNKRPFEQGKKHEENVGEKDEKYVKRPDNNEPRAKAWGNSDEAAEIIKKPRENPVVQENKGKPWGHSGKPKTYHH